MGANLIGTTSVKIKKLRPDAKLPTYGSNEAAGADLSAVFSPEDYKDGVVVAGQEAVGMKPGQRLIVKTGIAIEILPGFEAQIRPRSGLAAKNGITVVNAPGTIDSDYRGELMVILLNTGDKTFYINPGDRIAQMVIAPVIRGEFEEVETLDDTARGIKGFGSTGMQ